MSALQMAIAKAVASKPAPEPEPLSHTTSKPFPAEDEASLVPPQAAHLEPAAVPPAPKAPSAVPEPQPEPPKPLPEDIPASPQNYAPKRVREVPEDILRKVLED